MNATLFVTWRIRQVTILAKNTKVATRKVRPTIKEEDDMVTTQSLAFCEGEFVVKTLEGAELEQAYRLRHRVYAENLKWVPHSSDQCDIDIYDSWADSVGLFQREGRLVGVIRLLPSVEPFMLEKEFRAFLGSDFQIRKQSDTNEITRLALDPSLSHLKGLSARILRTLLKGLYLWTVENGVRYSYMVVEERFLRVLHIMGFPARPISSPIAFPPAGARSIAAMLDWDEFRSENASRRPAFFEWISNMADNTMHAGVLDEWRDRLHGVEERDLVLTGRSGPGARHLEQNVLAEV